MSLEKELQRIVHALTKRDGIESAYHKVADLAEKMRRNLIPEAG